MPGLATGEEFRSDLVQRVGPRLHAARGPGGEGGLGGCDGGVQLLDAGLGVFADDVRGARRIAVHAEALAGHPVARDQVAEGHGDQLTGVSRGRPA